MRLATALFTLAAVAACGGPGTDAPGRIHAGQITSSETWLAKDNPHLIKESVTIAGESGASVPVVTIEAGVVVEFAPDTSLIVGTAGTGKGGLVVNGTEDKPVRMVANKTGALPGHYAGIQITHGASRSELAYLEMENCGGDPDSGFANACISMRGEKAHKVDHVRIVSSASHGVALEAGAKFTEDSTTLVVEQTASDALLLTNPADVPTIPPGSSFGKPIRIRVENDVTKTVSWATYGVPYIIEGDLVVSDSSRPILTLAPGTTLRFTAGSMLRIGAGTGGDLKANGTAEAKITFTSSATPQLPGQWAGIEFAFEASANSSLSHAVVEYGGEYVGQAYDPANIQVLGDKGPIIKNTLIRKSKVCGIVRAEGDTPFTTDFTASAHGNVFEANEDGDQCDD